MVLITTDCNISKSEWKTYLHKCAYNSILAWRFESTKWNSNISLNLLHIFVCLAENRFWPLKPRQSGTEWKFPPPWRSIAFARVPLHWTRGPTSYTMITMMMRTWMRMRTMMKRTVAMTRTTPETRNHDNIPIFILFFISITPKVKPLRHASCIYTHSDGRFCFLNGLKRENLFSICCFPSVS